MSLFDFFKRIPLRRLLPAANEANETDAEPDEVEGGGRPRRVVGSVHHEREAPDEVHGLVCRPRGGELSSGQKGVRAQEEDRAGPPDDSNDEVQCLLPGSISPRLAFN